MTGTTEPTLKKKEKSVKSGKKILIEYDKDNGKRGNS